VFDPFFTTKPTAEAPGVGLYLSQQAMHDCGGNITVNSVKDEYTEFVISLT
jgi:C4-dicarboxylate-specific signal transduction histidine kinase